MIWVPPSIPPETDFAESTEAAKLRETQAVARVRLDSLLCFLQAPDGEEE